MQGRLDASEEPRMHPSFARARLPVRTLTLALAVSACAQGGGDSETSGGPTIQGQPGDQTPVVAGIHLGVNLSPVVDWGTAWPFVDAMRTARAWIPQVAEGEGPWDTGAELALDDRGWPRPAAGQAAATLLFRDVRDYPAGEYLCTWTGEGRLEFGLDASIVETRDHALLVDVTPSEAGILLRVVASDPEDPLRDIRVMMPGLHDAPTDQPFHPRFLERLAGFEVLRFMDWMRSNETPVVSWADRPRPDDASQATVRGVAPELMVALCRALDVDGWFCIPHQADDGYVRELATLVRDGMPAGRRAYVEYSNEIWNHSHRQGTWCQQRGVEMGLSPDPYQARLFYQAHRSKQIFAIWHDVFGGEADRRVVRVLAAQAANAWTSAQVLTYRDVGHQADALAIAPYFGHSLGEGEESARAADWTVDQVLDACAQDIDDLAERIVQAAEIAAVYELELVAYESGQHLVGVGAHAADGGLQDLFFAANRHPRMKDLYLQAMRSWSASGGTLNCLFSSCDRPSHSGSWGLLEHQEQALDEAPKMLAVREVLAAAAAAR